jgi:putative transposase
MTERHRHRPPHRTDAGRALFITASTHQRVAHMALPRRRDRFLELLFAECDRHCIELLAWVVLREHYHVVIVPEAAERVPDLITGLHRHTASDWNAEDDTQGRQVWYQYWDTTLWTDGDLWSRINYIHGNPVKHGYVQDPLGWPWSSYPRSLEWIDDPDVTEALRRFPSPRKLPREDF